MITYMDILLPPVTGNRKSLTVEPQGRTDPPARIAANAKFVA